MDKWKGSSGVDQDKAKKLQEGMRRAAEDNPVMNAYKWLTEKKPKTERDQES
jgi:hypothetical protein